MSTWDIMGVGIKDRVPLTKKWLGSRWKPTPTVPIAWLSGWNYCSLFTIEEQSGSNLEDYQVLVELSNTNFNFEDAQLNGEDIRFTLGNRVTLIDYWIEEWDNVTKIGKVWVKVPSIPASGTEVICMYYGNSSASSASNGTNTFEFFDDFKRNYLSSAIESTFEHQRMHRATDIVGSHAYVTYYGGFSIYDISNPKVPIPISNLGFGTDVLDIVVEGDYAYISDRTDDAIYIINVSDIYNPFEVGNIKSSTYLDFAHGVGKQGDYIICCAYLAHTLTIINVSDPTNPTIEGYIKDSDKLKYIHDVVVEGDYAYVACHSSGTEFEGRVTIINISDKSNPSIVSSISNEGLCWASDIQKKGDYCYTGCWPGHAPPWCHGTGCYIKVIDVSDVNNPTIVGSLEGSRGYILDIQGDYLYSANAEAPTNCPFDVIDISNPTTPTRYQRYANIPYNGLIRHVKATEDGKHAVLGDYSGTPSPFFIIDIEEGPSNWEGDFRDVTLANSVMTLTGKTTAFRNINLKESYETDYPIRLRTRMQFEAKNPGKSGVGFRDKLGNNYITIDCSVVEGIHHQPGSSQLDISINEGGYHIYEIIRKNASSDAFYEDGSQLGTDIIDGSTLGALPACFFSLGGVGYRIFSDWISLSKYVSPEPLITILGATPPGPILPPNRILTEAGYSLLQEDGSYLLHE